MRSAIGPTRADHVPNADDEAVRIQPTQGLVGLVDAVEIAKECDVDYGWVGGPERGEDLAVVVIGSHNERMFAWTSTRPLYERGATRSANSGNVERAQASQSSTNPSRGVRRSRRHPPRGVISKASHPMLSSTYTIVPTRSQSSITWATPVTPRSCRALKRSSTSAGVAMDAMVVPRAARSHVYPTTVTLQRHPSHETPFATRLSVSR